MSSKSLFFPYEIADSGKCVEDVYSRINPQVFWGHCQLNSQVRINSLSDYKTLLERLCDLNIKAIPFNEVDLTSEAPSDQVTCLIRHDLDIDIVSALHMAQLEFDYGIRSSWFLLHTSPYYGWFDETCNTFYRNGCMRHVYRELQDRYNHEVALHTDGLHVYQNWGRDGAYAVEKELEWLRSGGLKITGTTAHNSHSVYGAENFAIFKGRPIRSGANPSDCPREVVQNGKVALLQQLDESSLGLHYEANEIFWQSLSPVRYGATRGENIWRWVDNLARKKGPSLNGAVGMVSTEEFLENLAKIGIGEWLVLVVHPVYYGARESESKHPHF